MRIRKIIYCLYFYLSINIVITCSLLTRDTFCFFFFRFGSLVKWFRLTSISLSATDLLRLLIVVSNSKFANSSPFAYPPPVVIEYNTSPIDNFAEPSIWTTSWSKSFNGCGPKALNKSKVPCILPDPKYVFDKVCLGKAKIDTFMALLNWRFVLGSSWRTAFWTISEGSSVLRS